MLFWSNDDGDTGEGEVVSASFFLLLPLFLEAPPPLMALTRVPKGDVLDAETATRKTRESRNEERGRTNIILQESSAVLLRQI
jgi:hypothetical protein